jgi:antitoxin (DNA-binding transcriptional repressor) of toxin-antitoxin stability system
MADKMSDMKTVTVRELLRNHDRFASLVQSGETVLVTRREKPIYQMKPVQTPRKAFPDIIERLKAIYGDKVVPRERMAEIHRRNKGRR